MLALLPATVQLPGLQDKSAEEIKSLVNSWAAPLASVKAGAAVLPGKAGCSIQGGLARQPAKEAALPPGGAAADGSGVPGLKDVLRSEARIASSAARYKQARSTHEKHLNLIF